MDDEEWIEAEMDECFHQQPDEEYIDDYSYVDPRTGLTPKQQAWLDYQQAIMPLLMVIMTVFLLSIAGLYREMKNWRGKERKNNDFIKMNNNKL